MNETYKWLYDYYALPLMKVGKQAGCAQRADRLPRQPCGRAVPVGPAGRPVPAVGHGVLCHRLQLGLRLMAGQRADGLLIS